MIELEGVRVHNLKNIDLNIPLYKLVVISGVSGSGKSSLAFDTLYAEGQRRYIESFSAYARQFLDRLEKPDADRIEHIPPAIALRQNSRNLSSKSTIATATEIHDHLRLLFAKIGRIVCPDCQLLVRSDTPTTVVNLVKTLPAGTRLQICFPVECEDAVDAGRQSEQLKLDGFNRIIVDRRTVDLQQQPDALLAVDSESWIVVDRLVAGRTSEQRLFDSLELAFQHGHDRCLLLEAETNGPESGRHELVTLDDRPWRVHRFDSRLLCRGCQREFLAPEPRLFSFNTPLGACPECQGFGAVATISFDRLVPDRSKTLRQGAIAAWTTPAYRHELDELLELADDYGVPVDVPFSRLEARHLQLITDGVPERDFGGLRGFFRWLERHKYKLSVRVLLNRWRAYETCRTCRGQRLQPLALAVRIGMACSGQAGRRGSESTAVRDPNQHHADLPLLPKSASLNIAEVCRQTIGNASSFFDELTSRLSPQEIELSRTVLNEIRTRLRYLAEVGLEYLTLDRAMKSLSGGEAQRVALTATLGSSLVNTLYVLDEPSVGLHPRDSERVIEAICRLRDTRNTVLVVEHEDTFVQAADEVIDIGPGAGHEGGRIVYQGPPDRIREADESVTGAYLCGRQSIAVPSAGDRRQPIQGRLKLTGAREHNLKDLTVEFPLSLLCVVTGVSGSGKSTLIEETLYPAVCRALSTASAVTHPGKFDELYGAEEIDEVVLVDQTPVGRTPRSIPITYLKAFDEIRKVFAETHQARLKDFAAKQFSFNTTDGGRCPKCKGTGSISIDMQFLADVSMTCPECEGSRYRAEILEVKYRGLTIAEVLGLTVREAFTFFRNRPRLQKRLQFLKDVGLDYLPLGQPATTLSGGESQRLKLASFLASGSSRRTLFLIDEPTIGLHAADVARLLDCFKTLLSVGHSLIVIEHNLDVIKSADYVIDLGPEAGDAGGEIVARGTPEQICSVEKSITARYLRDTTNAK